ncbi:MAG: hypothetical protein IBJ11_08015 [Phycisphaerales bacterium]|nr:hypothetical protein [Phycisphaerales bacterium]
MSIRAIVAASAAGLAVSWSVLAAPIGVYNPSDPFGYRTKILSQDVKCGSTTVGSLLVNNAGVTRFSGPDNLGGGTWGLGGQTTIGAQFTPTNIKYGNLAWMQVVTGFSSLAKFSDRGPTGNAAPPGNLLSAPWPDTTPGGYYTSSIYGGGGNAAFTQNFDDLPWYGNNQVGQLSLFDQPKVGGSLAQAVNMTFESWLVCYIGGGGGGGGGNAPGSYSVIPLIGFTWGFNFNVKLGGPEINGSVIGDWEGDTSLTFLATGTGATPTNAFKTAYGNYWNINWIDNNDANCADCIPAPGVLATVGLAGVLASRRRRAA